MAAKQLQFSEEARLKLSKGMDVLATAVTTTLGPKGRNVALDRKFGSPTITHDGVTVAKEIELEDPYENMGAQLLKEAATKTNDIAGDGTTTSTVLAHAMVTEKVGKDGVITVEESKGLEFETEYVEGMQFDRGYISAYFVTDPEHMEAIISEPYLLIHDKKISAATDIVPILEKLVQIGKRELVVIAEDVDGEGS